MGRIVLDLENIFNFIAKDDKIESVETEISDGYEFNGSQENKTKVIRELKSKGANQRDNIRYDMVKFLLSVLFDTSANENTADLIGGNICFNTLLENKMIKEIE